MAFSFSRRSSGLGGLFGNRPPEQIRDEVNDDDGEQMPIIEEADEGEEGSGSLFSDGEERETQVPAEGDDPTKRIFPINRKVHLPGHNLTEVKVDVHDEQDDFEFGPGLINMDGDLFFSPRKSPRQFDAEKADEIRTLKQRLERKAKSEEKVIHDLEDVQRKLYTSQKENEKLKKELNNTTKELNETSKQLNRNFSDIVRDGNNGDITAGGHYRLKDAVALVREFSGENPYKLDAFLNQCEAARKLVKATDRTQLLDTIIKTKLEGRACLQLKHKVILTFPALKRELQAFYGSSKSMLEWQAEFSALRQNDNEDVTKYCARAERITAELIAATQEANNGVGEGKCRAIGIGVSTMAKAKFEQGLKSHLQVLVRAARCKTLHESCLEAIGQEEAMAKDNRGSTGPKKQQNVRKSFSSKSAECFNCGKPGHMAKDCRSQQAGQRKPQMPVAQNRPSVAAYNSVCKYCQLSGHDYATCRKLRRKLGAPDTVILKYENKAATCKQSMQQNAQAKENAAKKKNNGDDSSLPMGAYRIAMVNVSPSGDVDKSAEKIEQTPEEKACMVQAVRPDELENKILLQADELKQPTLFLTDSGASVSAIQIDKLASAVEIQSHQILCGIANKDVATL